MTVAMRDGQDGGGSLRTERLDAILEQLASDRSLRVVDLAGRLGVSAATIRRDLSELQRRHLLDRTHGGAVGRRVAYELPLRYKAASFQAEKVRIALAAAELVPDGAAIGLVGGTTTTEVARALIERRSLTVVTNALNIACELAVHPNIKLVLTGGVARSQSYELIGPLAEATLATLHLDMVFLGVDGISAGAGATTQNEGEAHTDRVMIRRAQQVVVVADRSKIGQERFAQICPVEAIQVLITDVEAEPSALLRLEEAGVRTVRA
jgi:DeoR family transcriptional regulator of aga operon